MPSGRVDLRNQRFSNLGYSKSDCYGWTLRMMDNGRNSNGVAPCPNCGYRWNVVASAVPSAGTMRYSKDSTAQRCLGVFYIRCSMCGRYLGQPRIVGPFDGKWYENIRDAWERGVCQNEGRSGVNKKDSTEGNADPRWRIWRQNKLADTGDPEDRRRLENYRRQGDKVDPF